MRKIVTPQIIIAIDPDVSASGVCILDTQAREIVFHTSPLPQLVEELRACHREKADLIIVIEASFLTQTNWHLKWDDSQRKASNKGLKIGRNHQLAYDIIAFCEFYSLPYEEKYPLKKCWAGKDGKITHDELMNLCEGMGIKSLNGKPTCRQSNQEERDAILLALDRSGIPLRTKVKRER